MKFPVQVGCIHFIGIGGIGMSGIAEALHSLDYKVSGSDMAENANVQRLRNLGIQVMIGHREENLDGVEVVVKSTAVKPDNPELKAARARGLPVVRRAEMLAELMRFKSCVAVAGTHGKTTTTTMVANLLEGGGLDPTVINGGIINAYGSNTRLGKGEWMVVEADESDGSFLKLPSEVALVTNIDPEHLDHFGSFEAIKNAFRLFVENLPFYGFAVMCADHPTVLEVIGQIEDRRIVTYGESPQADVRVENIAPKEAGMAFSVRVRHRRKLKEQFIENLFLPMPGVHNVLNATGAIAVALGLGIAPSNIRKSLSSFMGVKRRYTLTGEWNGIRFYDDYAHHPVEIAAVLKAARSICREKVIAIVQPHRFTRLRDQFDKFSSCFNDADVLIIAPVYPAGENSIEGINAQTLAEAVRAQGHRSVFTMASEKELPDMIRRFGLEGDSVVCLGAGNITNWANELPGLLKECK